MKRKDLVLPEIRDCAITAFCAGYESYVKRTSIERASRVVIVRLFLPCFEAGLNAARIIINERMGKKC